MNRIAASFAALGLFLASAMATAAENRDGIAVIIGNKTYRGATPAADFAHNDAEAMRRFVVETLGYRPGNVIDLRDATKARLESTFGTAATHEGRLHDWVRPGRSDVLVFYSGHGVPGLSDRRNYLLPVDGNPDRAQLTGYPLDLLYRNLARIRARSITVYLDACFSGQTPKGMLSKSMSGLTITPRKAVPKPELTVVTAAASNQVANWDLEARHGLFTHHLLRALLGAADAERYGNGDREVSLGELKAYLDDELSYQSRRRFGAARKQTATVTGDAARILAAYTPAKSPPTPRAEPRPSAEQTPPQATAPARDERVALVQRELVRLGLMDGGVDGIIGPRTRQALANFRIEYDVRPEPGVSETTLRALLTAKPRGAVELASPPKAASAPAPAAAARREVARRTEPSAPPPIPAKAETDWSGRWKVVWLDDGPYNVARITVRDGHFEGDGSTGIFPIYLTGEVNEKGAVSGYADVFSIVTRSERRLMITGKFPKIWIGGVPVEMTFLGK